jgi:tRNA-2-methylthio-N6-dimethylallyladenosine synthase
MNPMKRSYIETFGCQMNERDSEIMGQLLSSSDYIPTSDIQQADVIVINTCSIREKAEQKVYSLLGRLKKLKEKKPSLIISVAGCVAQQEGEKLQARMPLVDIVLGPQQIYRLAELVKNKAEKGKPLSALELSPTFEIPRYTPPPLPGKHLRPNILNQLNLLKSLSPSCRGAITSALTVLFHIPAAGKQVGNLLISLQR